MWTATVNKLIRGAAVFPVAVILATLSLLAAPVALGWQPVLQGDALLVAYTPDPTVWAKLTSIKVLYTQNSRTVTEVVNPDLGNESGTKSLIVVGSNELLDAAREIAELHRAIGVDTKIVLISDIAKSYVEALPPSLAVKGSMIRSCCNPGYNESIALKLISFLRWAVENGYRYVLLLGDDSLIPPLYYHSPILEYVSSQKHSLIPADYWYADPDYDGVAELAVGRLPFRYQWQAENYVDALRSWINSLSSKRSAVVMGGATFQTVLMLGEESAIKVYSALSTGFNSTLYVYSLGSYGPGPILSKIADAGIVYIVAHGIGNRIVDVFPKGLWGSTFSELLSASQAAALRPMIFVTPACMSAEWDYATIPPPFNPPSIGYSMVRYGAAVAYLGSSRIAIEAIYSVSTSTDWSFNVGYAGMVRLLESIVRRMASSKLLGDAVLSGINEYTALLGQYIAVLPSGVEDIAQLTLMEFTLLGDPAIPLPQPLKTSSARAIVVKTKPPDATAPLKLVLQPLSSIAEGRLAVYKPDENVTITLTACPENIKVWALKRYYGYMIADMVPVNYAVEKDGEECHITLRVDSVKPSLVELVINGKGYAEKMMLAIAGTAVLNGSVLITGLDLVRSIGDEPAIVTVNGRTYTILPGAADGALVAIPHGGMVSLKLWRTYSGVTVGADAEAEAERLVKSLFTTHIPSLSLQAVDRDGATLLAVTLDGKPVDANVTVESLSGGTAYAVKLSKGVYKLVSYSREPVLANVTVTVSEKGVTLTRSLVVVIGGSPCRSPELIFDKEAAIAGSLALIAVTVLVILKKLFTGLAG